MTSTLGAERAKVWDPLVRLGHWALVIGFAIEWSLLQVIPIARTS
ncbi:MAG TPA: hypothetical protein VNR65_04895 [Geobacterales bacterium]|nr:hypothetical protein [Geobacterales bacterium]